MSSPSAGLSSRPLDAEASAAVERARRIADPFLRSQALAHLAWHDRAGHWRRHLDESIEAAARVENPFQRASVLAWPLRVQLERGQSAAARVLAGEALARAAAIDVPVSRADALMWLWDAAVPYPGPVRAALLPALLEACGEARSWKGAVYLRDAALTLARCNPAGAATLIAAIPAGRQRRQAEARLAAGEFSAPRWFFDPAGSSLD